jgi:coenzyme F420 hydrogenase subunit beta
MTSLIAKTGLSGENGMSDFPITKVVEGGFCVGCGACAVVCDAITMKETQVGTFEPDLSRADVAGLAAASAVCPFSSLSPDETAVGNALFAQEGGTFDPKTGWVNLMAAGGLTDPVQREASSSGGLTTWVLGRLLDTGLVDGVIHLGSAQGGQGGAMFSYAISRSRQDLLPKSKSKYYASTIAEVLKAVRGDGLRYAFVGVPCFVTATRHIAAADPVYGEQLAFFIGLVCGHMKSTRFAELMAWQVGVPPQDLACVDFRLKERDRKSSEYRFAAQSRQSGAWHSAPTRSLYGADWGQAFFQPKACDFCDDIFAESADIALGDAWLPQYEANWLGTNVLVSRRRELDEMLRQGVEAKEIQLEPLSMEATCATQGGNFRHRRDGLALRLHDAAKRGQETPPKRVAPSASVNMFRRRIIRLRERTAAASHLAFQRARTAGDLDIFRKDMAPLTKAMENTYRMIRWFSPGQVKARAARILKRR